MTSFPNQKLSRIFGSQDTVATDTNKSVVFADSNQPNPSSSIRMLSAQPAVSPLSCGCAMLGQHHMYALPETLSISSSLTH